MIVQGMQWSGLGDMAIRPDPSQPLQVTPDLLPTLSNHELKLQAPKSPGPGVHAQALESVLRRASPRACVGSRAPPVRSPHHSSSIRSFILIS